MTKTCYRCFVKKTIYGTKCSTCQGTGQLHENAISIHKAPDEGLRKYHNLVKLKGGPINKHEEEFFNLVARERARRKLRRYLTRKSLKEDAPTVSVGTGAIAGIGISNPFLKNQAEPGVIKKKRKLLRRITGDVKSIK